MALRFCISNDPQAFSNSMIFGELNLKSLKKAGTGAFAFDTEISSIILPDTFTEIPDRMFYDNMAANVTAKGVETVGASLLTSMPLAMCQALTVRLWMVMPYAPVMSLGHRNLLLLCWNVSGTVPWVRRRQLSCTRDRRRGS